uniref:Sorting nexin-7-like n=1 Tax=Phallusia mammillata TaxID=59560 RepID=A0A6F9DSN5_9ASCI|nr:sorting nexin-7-like [Phallusia mammillata]
MENVDPLTAATNEPSDPEDELNTYHEKVDAEEDNVKQEEWDTDAQDLFTTVDNPEKHILAMETYISYRVTTKTTRSCFDNSEYMTQRRYQDFVWLRTKLENDHPTHLIPPLPAKFVVKGMLDRFNAEFTKRRCMALHKFLSRLSEHPVLSFNENLKVFLTSKAHEFTAYRKQSDGIMSKVSGSMKSIATNTRVKERDPEFNEMLDYITDFSEKMGVLDRIGERLLLEKKELTTEMKEFGPTFSMWASGEDDTVSPIMTSISECLDLCTGAAEENAKRHELNFVPPLKEYILYSDAVKQVLKRRDGYQANYDRLVDEHQKRRSEKENLPKSDQSYSISAMMGKSPDEVKQQKEQKLNQQIEELAEKRDKSYDELEKANGNLRADKDRWTEHKIQDLATLFADMAQSQITYHTECLSAWENILPTMQEPSAENQQ